MAEAPLIIYDPQKAWQLFIETLRGSNRIANVVATTDNVIQAEAGSYGIFNLSSYA